MGYDGSIRIDSKIDNKGFNKGVNSMISSLKRIGIAVGVAFSAKAIIGFVKTSVNAASELSNAFTGLESILEHQGKSFEKAKGFIEEYISDGLVSATEATTAYKNLTLRGYNEEQIQKLMIALKDSATFGRQSNYELGEAIATASEGLKNENSILVDNAGVTKNVAKMWDEYAKSIGKTSNQLTQQEKIQAEVNGIIKETESQTGDATRYLDTYSGQLARLNASFTTLKQTIGNIFIPVFRALIPYINAVIQGLIKVAQTFAAVVQLIFKKTISTNNQLANSSKGAASGISGMGDAAEKAGKQAKGALASFDDLSVLAQDTGLSSGGGNSGVDIGSEVENLSLNGEEIGADVTISPTLYKTIEIIKQLAEVCKQGFEINFGNKNFDDITNNLSRIQQKLISIFTDGEVANSANTMINQLAMSLGQSVGSIARIGTNIAENFIGSIDKYLSQNAERIKDFLKTMFDIGTRDFKLTGKLWQALGEISDIFSNTTAKQIGGNIIAIFSNPLMSIIEFCSKFITDLRAVLVQPIIDNSNRIKKTIQNLLTPIKKVTGTLTEAFTYLGDKLNEVYDNSIGPFMESLKIGLSDTFGKFLDVYNEYIIPVLDSLAEKFSILWNEHLKPLVDKIGEFISSTASALIVLWEEVLKPFIDWLVANIIPVVVPIFEGVWNTIYSVFGSIADTIGGIIDVFKGLIDFIVGIFTGNWNKAWEGIKTFFSGIWNSIQGIVAAVWNAMYGIIKTVINAIQAVVTTAFNAIRDFISNIWNKIANTISNVWDTIKTKVKDGAQGAWDTIVSIFSNIPNWFKNTFTKAWQNVKDVFSTGGKIFDGIKEGIATTFITIVNGIIGGINKIIKIPFDTINKTLNKIKDASFLGVAPFQNMWGYNPLKVPQIPQLATGAVIPPNQKFLAVLGDQKNGRNLEAPESLIRQIVREESNNNNSPIIINATIELEGTTLGRKIIQIINREQEAAGKTLLKI